jgi:pullulanase/glycogen debranching enzyme
MSPTLARVLGGAVLVLGDELGRTQGGNNNAYCQDNEISWFDWSAADPGADGLHRRPGGVPPGHTRSSAGTAS